MEAWYAVHTKARQEQLALANLERQHFLGFLPLIRLPRHRRDAWVEVTEPLFPGYLFLRLDPRRDDTAPIRSTRGVIGMVRFGGTMRPVPQALIQGLREIQTDPEGAIRREQLFQAGGRVAIVSGPLAGLEAIFLASTGQQRVRLLLCLLGRETTITIPRDHLAPVH